MLKRILWILLVALFVLIIFNYGLVSYGIKQGIGQLSIINEAREIEDVMQDPSMPDSIKNKISLVQETIQFGVEEIGLKDRGNYQTYYDQGGESILFLVTAAKPFELTPYEWHFPVLGNVPYKGFFDEGEASEEWQKMKDKGLDTYIRTPGGWSTLGWFNDPILSNMLERNTGDLVNVILHELTHATIFVKDSIEYNENLATFIGDRATEQFLIKKYGRDSDEWNTYIRENSDYDKFVAHILRGTRKLDSLYNSFNDVSAVRKSKHKKKLITEIINQKDTLTFFYPSQYQWEKDFLPNNAYFMSFLRYQGKQDRLQKQLEEEYDNDLQLFVTKLSERYN